MSDTQPSKPPAGAQPNSSPNSEPDSVPNDENTPVDNPEAPQLHDEGKLEDEDAPVVGPPAPDVDPEPAPDEALDAIAPMQQEMTDARPDNPDETEKVGFGNPPKKSRFKKGTSGNPSGKRKKPLTPPGNLLQNIGHEIVDEIIQIFLGRVTDLQVKPDDSVTTAYAKVVAGDGLKKDGAFRKFVLSQFLEKPLQSERLAPVDKGELEAQILQKLLSAVVDPEVRSEDLDAIMKEAKEHHETYGQFGARRRKERKNKRRPRRHK